MDIEFIDKLKKKLNESLPGEKAQYQMAPSLRIFPESKYKYKKAAVIILLFPSEKGISTVFMKRNEYDGPHSGQISFPGGQEEEEDESLEATAKRETSEELGIDTKNIKVLGNISSLHIPISNFHVFPFVAYTDNLPYFNPDKSEVHFLITATLSDLLNPQIKTKKLVTINNKCIEVPFFSINGNEIWGATAMILNEFLVLLRTINLKL